MAIRFIKIDIKSKLRILLSILFVEYIIVLFSDISFSSLNGDSLFSIGIDPFFWVVYIAKFPQTILKHEWIAFLCDACIILSFIFLMYNPYKNKIAMVLFCLLLIFYMTYMGLISSRNYMTGFFLVLLPFIFRENKNKQISFEAMRYFLLFFYFSAALIKVQQKDIYGVHYFSNILINQLTPYYLEQNLSIRTDVNLYLIAHPSFSRILFFSGTILELIPLIGFFTKRFDTYLAIIILIFHFSNWFIMDIAPIGQIAFICTLFYSNKFCWKTFN